MSSRVTGVVLIYALFAAGWILFSDSLLGLLLTDPEHLLIASTLKGWSFVAVTSLLLWSLLRRLPPDPAQDAEAGSLRAVLPPFALLALGVIGLGMAGVVMTLHERSALEGRRLEAVADLKVGQITRWLDERRADAQAAAGQAGIIAVRETWTRSGPDPVVRARLTAFLEGVRRPYRYRRVALVDADGRVVMSSDGHFAPAAELRDAVSVALREG